MIGGQIHQIGTKDEIYYGPGTLEVARFLLNQNIFAGEVTHVEKDLGEITLGSGELAVKAVRKQNERSPAVGEKVYFGIRPEEIMLIRPDRPLRPQVRENLFSGKIAQIFEKGGSHIVLFSIPQMPILLEMDIPNCAYRDMNMGLGNEVRVSLKRNAVWILPENHRPGAKLED